MSVEATAEQQPSAGVRPGRSGRYPGLEDLVEALQHRTMLFLGFVGAILAILFPPTGLGFSTCTMITAVGLPCPSCGLTRSVTCIYHGMFHAAWQYNPFGYGFALLFGFYAILFVVPRRFRDRLREASRRHALTVSIVVIVFIAGLLVHGIARAVWVGTGDPDYLWWRRGSVPPVLQEQQTAAPEISAGPDDDCCANKTCTHKLGGADG